MRIHSDIINRDHIQDALIAAKKKGHVSHHVLVDLMSVHGSRKRKGAIEVQLGSDTSESFIAPVVLEYAEDYGVERKVLNKIKRRGTRQGKSYDDYLRAAATWHEYGHFIAELFAIDPNAIIGDYDDARVFYYQTWEFQNYRRVDPMTINGRCYDFLGDIEDWEERTNGYNYYS